MTFTIILALIVAAPLAIIAGDFIAAGAYLVLSCVVLFSEND